MIDITILAPILIWLAITIIFFIFNVFLLLPLYFKIKNGDKPIEVRAVDFVLSPFITLLFIVVICIDVYEYLKKIWSESKINVNAPFNYIGKLSNKMWGNDE